MLFDFVADTDTLEKTTRHPFQVEKNNPNHKQTSNFRLKLQV